MFEHHKCTITLLLLHNLSNLSAYHPTWKMYIGVGSERNLYRCGVWGAKPEDVTKCPLCGCSFQENSK